MSWRYFAVLCDSRKGTALEIDTLALTDRFKNQPGVFWTSDDPSLIMRFRNEESAKRVVKRMLFNNPRVVPFEEAYRIIAAQQGRIISAELGRLSEESRSLANEDCDGKAS